MRPVQPMLLAAAFAALAGCGDRSGNASANAVGPPPPEEGYDANMVIGGDELSPLPGGEAVEPANGVVVNDLAPIGNDAAPGQNQAR